MNMKMCFIVCIMTTDLKTCGKFVCFCLAFKCVLSIVNNGE